CAPCRGYPTPWPPRCTPRSTAPPWRGSGRHERASRRASERAWPERPGRRPGAEDMSERPDDVDTAAVWEEHAAWWQAEFTYGADVEYSDQILPLVVRHIAGA